MAVLSSFTRFDGEATMVTDAAAASMLMNEDGRNRDGIRWARVER